MSLSAREFNFKGRLVAILLACTAVLSACSSSNGDKSPVDDDPGSIPSIPGNLTSNVYSSHEAELFWTPSTDDGWVLGYDIFRDSVLVAEQLDVNSYFDGDLEPATTYQFSVVAVDDDGNRSLPTEIYLTTDSAETPSDDGPGNTIAVITVDNHVELLKYVFDIFTGRKYGRDMLGLPGYPDPAYEDTTITPDSVVETATCINGGTATFTPFFKSEFYSGGDRDGWNFDFENCQYDAIVYDGLIVREKFRRGGWWVITSTGLRIESQLTKTSFSGYVEYKPGTVSGEFNRHYMVDDVDLSIIDSTGIFELTDTVFEFGIVGNSFIKTLAGRYSVKSVVTGSQRLDVQVLEPLRYNISDDPNGVPADPPDDFAYFFQTGILQVSAANGDYLRLDAETGDNATVSIEISSGAETKSLQQPWSIWRDNLEFNFDFSN